jgi:signal transduction histidine kinase
VTTGLYTQTDLPLALELARRAAMAIDNSRLYGQAQAAISLRDEFLDVASHELRTPITSLQLAIQGLSRDAARTSPERLSRELQLAERQTAKLVRLVEEMLSVGRVQTGTVALHPEPVDLVAIVQEIAGWFEGELASAKCSIHVNAPAVVIGTWDRMKIEQVVTNLLSNAIKRRLLAVPRARRCSWSPRAGTRCCSKIGPRP